MTREIVFSLTIEATTNEPRLNVNRIESELEIAAGIVLKKVSSIKMREVKCESEISDDFTSC